MKTLYLSLKKEPFEVMVTGEKKEEFRVLSDWMSSRLMDADFNDKEYDVIKFVNGYGPDKPYFICKYEGWNFVPPSEHDKVREYSNGLRVYPDFATMVIIGCGEILERGNL